MKLGTYNEDYLNIPSILETLDININSACNRVILSYYKEQVVYNETLHRGGHSDKYLLEVNERLEDTLKSFDLNLSHINIKTKIITYTSEEQIQ